MSQMYYMGKNNGARLVDTCFEAWDYGPVSPALYRRVKAFGSSPIQDIFYDARFFGKDDPRKETLEEVCSDLLPKSPGELVEVTHWEKGAWAKRYVPGQRNIPISDADIFNEFQARIKEFSIQ